MFFTSHSVEETRKIASLITKNFLVKNKRLIFLIQGELGAGKTEFVKGVAEQLGFSYLQIKSPTFVLMTELTNNKYTMYHIDLYRVEKKFAVKMVHDLIEEIEFLDNKKLVFCIEWADRLVAKNKFLIPYFGKTILVNIKIKKAGIRQIVIKEVLS